MGGETIHPTTVDMTRHRMMKRQGRFLKVPAPPVTERAIERGQMPPGFQRNDGNASETCTSGYLPAR